MLYNGKWVNPESTPKLKLGAEILKNPNTKITMFTNDYGVFMQIQFEDKIKGEATSYQTALFGRSSSR